MISFSTVKYVFTSAGVNRRGIGVLVVLFFCQNGFTASFRVFCQQTAPSKQITTTNLLLTDGVDVPFVFWQMVDC
jgi:hypothetical protein